MRNCFKIILLLLAIAFCNASVFADIQNVAINKLDSILKEDFISLDLNKSTKISNLFSFLYNQQPEQLMHLWAHIVDNIYQKNIPQLDKQAFIEIVFKKEFMQRAIFHDKNVRSGFVQMMKDETTSDNAINEALGLHLIVLQYANDTNINTIQDHFTMIQNIAENKKRCGITRKNAFRELGRIPLEGNLTALLKGVSENDTGFIEGIGSGLNKILSKYETWNLISDVQKNANKKLISNTILSYFATNPPKYYQQKFLFLPLGETGTSEAKTWLIGQLRKTSYKDYMFVLPSLKNQLDKNNIKEIMTAFIEHKIDNLAMGASVVSQSIKDNFGSFKELENDSAHSSKLAYLDCIVLFNRIGENKASVNQLLKLLSDPDPDVREKAVLAVRLNLPNHYEILSNMVKTEKSHNVRNILELYGYHMSPKLKNIK